jgi:hypothetical protein
MNWTRMSPSLCLFDGKDYGQEAGLHVARACNF